MPSFYLTADPWIPCVPLRGSRPSLLSLRDTLVTASEQREILDNSPLVTVAIHRLLLAVLHRILRGPRNEHEWRALKAAGRFDADMIDTYLRTWHSRFNLFDCSNPFYQVPFMDVEPRSAANIAHERASGNNLTLFDHTTGDAGKLTPAQAARYLLAFQVFAIGGGISQPFNLSDAPLARDYTVLVQGENLFETLLLNLVQYTAERPIPWLRDDDPPWWERETHPEPDRNGTRPSGYLDYLTWQSRRIHLICDETTGQVRQCQIRQNLKLAADVLDPFKSYKHTKEGGWQSRRFALDRAVWRDSHALLEIAHDAADSGDRRPAVFDWLATAVSSGSGLQRGNSPQLDFDVLGALNDGTQATVILWRHDRLPLPVSYLTQRPLRDKLKDALSLAEDVSALFKPEFYSSRRGKNKFPRPVRVLAAELLTGSSQRTADVGAVKDLVKHFGVERAYWAALEPRFRRLMVSLPNAMSSPVDVTGKVGVERVLADWAQEVRACAYRAFKNLVNSLDTNARALRATALAEREFNVQLAECMASDQPSELSEAEIRS